MKNLLFKSTPELSTSHELTMTILRVFAGLSMAFAHGLGKVPPSEQLIGGVSSMGLPAAGFFAWVVALSEFGGGILLALGLLTRVAAFFLFCTMFVAAFLVHGADPFNVKELAFLYLVIYTVFLARGASSWSIDRFISKNR
jgi:putative oxidoreductase